MLTRTYCEVSVAGLTFKEAQEVLKAVPFTNYVKRQHMIKCKNFDQASAVREKVNEIYERKRNAKKD